MLPAILTSTAPTLANPLPPIPMRRTVDELACCGLNSCAASLPSTSCVARVAHNATSSACCPGRKPQIRLPTCCAPSASLPSHRYVLRQERRRKSTSFKSLLPIAFEFIRCDVDLRFSRALASWHFSSHFWLFFAALGRQFDNLTSKIARGYPPSCHKNAFVSYSLNCVWMSFSLNCSWMSYSSPNPRPSLQLATHPRPSSGGIIPRNSRPPACRSGLVRHRVAQTSLGLRSRQPLNPTAA